MLFHINIELIIFVRMKNRMKKGFYWKNCGVFLSHMLPTRYTKASLEDLIHGLGVVMVMSHQLGPVAHHGPASSAFMLMCGERVRVTSQIILTYI